MRLLLVKFIQLIKFGVPVSLVFIQILNKGLDILVFYFAQNSIRQARAFGRD